jgi:hypothetical protein
MAVGNLDQLEVDSKQGWLSRVAHKVNALQIEPNLKFRDPVKWIKDNIIKFIEKGKARIYKL